MYYVYKYIIYNIDYELLYYELITMQILQPLQ